MNIRIVCSFFVLLGCSQPIHAQGQETDPGFINIDCGAAKDYYDATLQLHHATDDKYVDSGEDQEATLANQLQTKTLRSFPNGTRNCYTLKPTNAKNTTFLIRAVFFYGNYDGMNQAPAFDVHIGVNYWLTVNNISASTEYYEIEYTSLNDNIQVCLINTGNGTPYISALRLRMLDNSIYSLRDASLILQWRLNVGSLQKYRHPSDPFDRIWEPKSYDHLVSVKSNSTNLVDNDEYRVPGEVLMNAQKAVASNSSLILSKSLTDVQRWYIFFHFTEVEILPNNTKREFNIYVNNEPAFTNPIRLEYLKPLTVASPIVSGLSINVSINATDNTNPYPPILNAIEYFTVLEHRDVSTFINDVNAVYEIKEAFGVTKDSWQGDPCVPANLIWDGLNCSYGNASRILSLNLSSNRLGGDLARVGSLSELLSLEILDLSRNQLTGEVPDFLGKLPKLKVLDLSGNNLTGSIPKSLRRTTLNLSVADNPELCVAVSCKPDNDRHVIIIVTASVGAMVVLLFIALAIICKIRRSKTGQGTRTINFRTRRFSYSEVVKITDNLKTVIGEGGFGKVYHGNHDGMEVAVKLLFISSNQGFKEFQAEAELLMGVSHRNLVSLIGFCDEDEKMVLIYEFMTNGDLKQHLTSERDPNVLTWTQRVRIALDTAQGLDYLHNGCKIPIIHRDLKPANILLNGSMQAKIADFGLSKAFKTEHDTHITTTPAGTRGYLDPEFHASGILTKKSDIYSFGIILFELVTGYPPFRRGPDGNIVGILPWVFPFIESGDIQSIVDNRLNVDFSINTARKLVEIAVTCVEQRSIQRPDISFILAELKECWKIEESAAANNETKLIKPSNMVESGGVLDEVLPSPR